jgi:hypothetical protein
MVKNSRSALFDGQMAHSYMFMHILKALLEGSPQLLAVVVVVMVA